MLIPAAFAAEPPWVEVAISSHDNPGDDVCPPKRGLGRPSTEMPPANGAALSMPRFDTAQGAKNAGLPEAWRASLALPFDIAKVPLEPLRGRPEDLERVHAVLEKIDRKQGMTRIGFWGASHVAGEYFTGEIRRVLQERGGDGGHGFVMPAAPWRYYRASDVSLCSSGTWTGLYDGEKQQYHQGRVGPAGIAVEPAPGASGWMLARGSRFEVGYLLQKGGGSIDLAVDDMPPLRTPTDGEGPGMLVVHVPDGPHRLRTSAVGDGPVRLVGVNVERQQGVVVDAMGVVGRQGSSWQRWDAGSMRPYLDRRKPDLAVLAYGTNESGILSFTPTSYRDELRKTLTRFRAVLPEAACVLIGPSDRAKHLSKSVFVIWSPVEMIAAAQRDVGPEFGCVTWDLQAATGGPGSLVRWKQYEPQMARADLVHFSPEGYVELARRFLSAWEGAR